MNDFEPRQIRRASRYLQESLSACKKSNKKSYTVKEKKDSFFRQLFNLLFRH
jgi:hypothetical protein